jgi:hypothetical protein
MSAGRRKFPEMVDLMVDTGMFDDCVRELVGDDCRIFHPETTPSGTSCSASPRAQYWKKGTFRGREERAIGCGLILFSLS